MVGCCVPSIISVLSRTRKIDSTGPPSICFHLVVLFSVSHSEELNEKTEIPMKILPRL